MKEQNKDILLEAIRQKSEREARRLSREFVRAAAEEKEAILAELELEQWVADTCVICLPIPNVNL